MLGALQILIVEDNPDDAALLQRELSRVGYAGCFEVVDNEAAFAAQLKKSPDLIFSDYEMPHFSGLRALEILAASGLDIPFIIISGTIGEETAVAAMKTGAADYLMKDRLGRLGPAVANALEKCESRAERRLSVHRLRESEERLRQLIENSSDTIVVIDEFGIVGFQSPSMERTLGYEPDAMFGRNVLEIVHLDDQSKVRQSISEALADHGKRLPVEYRIRHRDGSWRIFQSIGKSMIEAGGRVKIVVNSRDVTESRLLEAKFLRAQRLEAVGTLASGVAHDLNNILTPVLMVAGLLKETLVKPRDRDLLSMVERSAKRGAAIVSQLLTFSRGIEGAKANLQPRYLIKEVGNLIQETFPRNIALVQNIPDDLWDILVDATQLHQVLLNLCVNARDAMPEGGTITVKAANVDLVAAQIEAHAEVRPGPYLEITVTDSGCGIPTDIINRVFDPFFTTKEMGKGTGLGLSTVLGIVKSHQGFVTVESQPGNGTSFHIFLPALGTAEEARKSLTAPPMLVGNGEVILLVDDEQPILDALRGILEKQRYRVLTANNGQEAIRVFIEHSEVIHLIVTDLMMPVMDGVSLIKTLRVIKPSVLAMAMTGLEQEDRQVELASLGVTEIVAKPFSPVSFLQALHRVLE